MNPSLSQLDKTITEFRKQKSSELATFKLTNPEDISGTILFEVYSNSDIIKCNAIYGHIELINERGADLKQLYLSALDVLKQHQSFLDRLKQIGRESQSHLDLNPDFSKHLYSYYRTKTDVDGYQCTKFSRYNTNNIYTIVDENENIGFIVEHKNTPLFWYYGCDLDEMLSEVCSMIDEYEQLLNELNPKTTNKL